MIENAMFHHARNLAGIRYGVVKADPQYSYPEYLPAYPWLEEQVGFFPLFIAVGDSEEVLWQTGYQNQWRVRVDYNFEKRCPIYRRRGEFPNKVLFSFTNLDGVFFDSIWWTIVLNDCLNSSLVDKQTRRCLFKASWTKSRWLCQAKKCSGSVELVVPSLDLSQTIRVGVRNQRTKRVLENLGFCNVEVMRIYIRDE